MPGGGFPRAPQTEARAHRSWWSGSTAPVDSVSGSTPSPARSPAWGQACQLHSHLPSHRRAMVEASPRTPWLSDGTHTGQWDLARSLLTSPQGCPAPPQAPLRVCSSQPTSQHLPAVCTPPGWTFSLTPRYVSHAPMPAQDRAHNRVSVNVLNACTDFWAFMGSVNSRNKKNRS